MDRPTVEFASCVWDPHERVDIKKLKWSKGGAQDLSNTGTITDQV